MPLSRRRFLQSVSLGGLAPFHALAAPERGRVKITDVKVMMLQGPRTYTLIKVLTDSGVYGIGEAYWGWGVKDLVLNKMAPIIIGEDPLNVEKLYTKMLMQSAGAGAIAGAFWYRVSRR